MPMLLNTSLWERLKRTQWSIQLPKHCISSVHGSITERVQFAGAVYGHCAIVNGQRLISGLFRLFGGMG